MSLLLRSFGDHKRFIKFDCIKIAVTVIQNKIDDHICFSNMGKVIVRKNIKKRKNRRYDLSAILPCYDNDPCNSTECKTCNPLYRPPLKESQEEALHRQSQDRVAREIKKAKKAAMIAVRNGKQASILSFLCKDNDKNNNQKKTEFCTG